MLAIHQLRVNVKSLAQEARYIRKEIAIARDSDIKSALRCHRIFRLRPEARLASLALAYARGIPYQTVERKAREKPTSSALFGKVRRFMPVTEDEIKDWLGA